MKNVSYLLIYFGILINVYGMLLTLICILKYIAVLVIRFKYHVIHCHGSPVFIAKSANFKFLYIILYLANKILVKNYHFISNIHSLCKLAN